MKSYFDGNGIGGTKHHTVQYFDGQKLREIQVTTFNGKISWTERAITGIIETGANYRNAKRKLASYEERCTRRIG